MTCSDSQDVRRTTRGAEVSLGSDIRKVSFDAAVADEGTLYVCHSTRNR